MRTGLSCPGITDDSVDLVQYVYNRITANPTSQTPIMYALTTWHGG